MLVGRGCSFYEQVRNQFVRVFRGVVLPSRVAVTNVERLREISRTAKQQTPSGHGNRDRGNVRRVDDDVSGPTLLLLYRGYAVCAAASQCEVRLWRDGDRVRKRRSKHRSGY